MGTHAQTGSLPAGVDLLAGSLADQDRPHRLALLLQALRNIAANRPVIDTDPLYQHCGLARAGLAALRTEHSGLSWHTRGGHLTESQDFWAAVGADG